MLSILLAMISTSSLAALSAALSPALPSGVAAARAVPVNAQVGRTPTAGAGNAGSGGASGPIIPPVLRPGQILPRGSVLNLSV